ncbi:HIT family protein [Patescibacteria group bacterium]|nr:HIT family protein [Patescibacteria group bacterium]MBU1868199.1 HIT family protein [Patescibacteria group bacterium]
MKCLTCLNLSGEQPIFPESRIYESRLWLIEHVYPTKLLGWFVIILKRHTESLHDLSREEFEELAAIQFKLTKQLNEELKLQKEYSVCFAEHPSYRHVHFHIIPILKSLDEKHRGSNVFSLLRIPEEESISKRDIIKFCKRIKRALQVIVSGSRRESQPWFG